MLDNKNISNMKTFTCCHCLKKIQTPPILPTCKNHLCNECCYFLLSTSINNSYCVQNVSQIVKV
jgi:hypothetical protein